MKALSLYQPYASLIITRWPSGRFCKRFETRGWRTNYRGPIAICATAKTPKSLVEFVDRSPFREALRGKYALDFSGDGQLQTVCELPFGCVLGIGRLAACVPIEEAVDYWIDGDESEAFEQDAEIAFGDYSPGRWAWLIEDMRPLKTPIPVKGKQGLWEWAPTAELEFVK